ncbi:MAG: NAD(P)-binding domain-containing protein [Thermodesulfobacteriota bacterium]|nr:NAD(P)-binding domain-containing protein [Thermodesulfobacteriota bacterium]
MKNFDPSRIAIIGPGRLGTAFAYKFGRDGKDITIYYHDAEICREINQTHLNPRHLTDDLAKISGGMENVPGLSGVTATNDLERVVEENDFIILSITMDRLRELLDYIKPLIARKKGGTCLVSPIKGLASNEKTRELITPSQMIKNHLFDLKHKFDVICIGGPFFDVDIATGRPVCVTVAGDKHAAKTFNLNFLRLNRRELNSYYNFDVVGIEACGALKNIIANIKGAADCLNLGSSLPGTIFARSGVEIRALVKLLGGSFQAFHSQAGVGDMYVTVSSEASKNYRYGKYFYELFDGNPIETSINTLKKIDGTPEGPNTIKSVHRYLEKKNMYSPLFHCAYKIFHEETNRNEIREHVIQACQFDKRNKEYIGTLSKLLYRIFPNIWYRRDKGFLSKLDFRRPSR